MPLQRPIYLDYNATTPVDPRVRDAMMPYFTEKFGNAASSTHLYGWEAAAAVKKARDQVATLIGTTAETIIFTSGATEANNLALKGIVAAAPHDRPHLITQKTEHESILDTCRALETTGVEVTYLDVDPDGRVTPDDVKSALRDTTVLVSIMSANNEIGTLQPIAEIAAAVHTHPTAHFHTDAVQAAGKISLNVTEADIDLLSLSAHKLYGPKGIGALYVRKRRPPIALAPLLHGGGHEHGLRSGTLAVPLIVGFGEAAAIAKTQLTEDATRLASFRDHLYQTLSIELEGITRNGHSTLTLPNTLNISIQDIDGATLIGLLPELALSTGSACTSSHFEPSHVIRAISHDDARARSAIRISLGRFTTPAEVDRAAAALIAAIRRLRK